MTTRTLRLLATAAVALLSSPAFAHDIDCDKTVGVVATNNIGTLLFELFGVVTFASDPSGSLAIDEYPTKVAWVIQLNNRAEQPSTVTGFEDPFLDGSDVTFVGPRFAPGDVLAVGESRTEIAVQQIDSYEACLALGGGAPASTAAAPPIEGPPPDGLVCRAARVNVATVTTETSYAQCRARLICNPPPALTTD